MYLKVISILIISCLFLTTPCSAGIWDDFKNIIWHRERTVERTEEGVTITTQTHLERKQTSEILRRQDLLTAVRDSLARAKDALQVVLQRLQFRIRDHKNFTAPKDNAIKDIVARNQAQQESARRRQEDLLQTIKDRTESLQQRIRDQARSR